MVNIGTILELVKLLVVAHILFPALGKLRYESHEFEASLGSETLCQNQRAGEKIYTGICTLILKKLLQLFYLYKG